MKKVYCNFCRSYGLMSKFRPLSFCSKVLQLSQRESLCFYATLGLVCNKKTNEAKTSSQQKQSKERRENRRFGEKNTRRCLKWRPHANIQTPLSKTKLGLNIDRRRLCSQSFKCPAHCFSHKSHTGLILNYTTKWHVYLSLIKAYTIVLTLTFQPFYSQRQWNLG